MMKEVLPKANYGLLVHKFTKNKTLDDIKAITSKYKFFCCGLNVDIINKEIIDSLLSNNLVITVYSKNNIKMKNAEDLWTIGVKSIFTDDPREFKLY